MSAKEIAALVDRGIEIVALQSRLATELKGIAAKLTQAGLAADHQELKDADRDGRQFLARGSAAIVPVVFSADLLIATFKPDSATHEKLTALAGEQLPTFFRRVELFEKTIKDGKAFRAKADELLAAQAPPFITACLQMAKGIPKSGIKVEWKKGLASAGIEAGEEEE